ANRRRTGDPRVSVRHGARRRDALTQLPLVLTVQRVKTHRRAKGILYSPKSKLVLDTPHPFARTIGQTCIRFAPTASFFATLSKGSAEQMRRELCVRRARPAR